MRTAWARTPSLIYWCLADERDSRGGARQTEPNAHDRFFADRGRREADALPFERGGGESPYAIRDELQNVMQRLVGIFRTRKACVRPLENRKLQSEQPEYMSKFRGCSTRVTGRRTRRAKADRYRWRTSDRQPISMARQGTGTEDEQLDSECGAVTAAYLSSVGADRTAES